MKRPVRWFLPALLACSASFVAAKAAALTDLTSGRRLVLRDRENPRSDRAVFRFANDPELIFISVSPLCPVESSVQIVTDTAVHAPQVLDCTNWQISGSGVRYKENPAGKGSLRRLVLRSGRLADGHLGRPEAHGLP